MKKTAKIVAIILSLMMVLSVASAYVIYADAAGAPTLTITETGKTDDTVTVAVKVTSGSFNAMDFQFNTSGVTCESITATGGYGNKANGKVSMASIDGYTGGNVITATFKLPEDGSYSISGSASSCTVTENGGNREVGASVSGSVSGTKTKPTEKPTTTKPTTSTTKSTTKPTTSTTKSTTKPTISTTKLTTKSVNPKSTTKATTAPTRKGQTTTIKKTDTDISTTKLPDDIDESTTEDVTLPEDEDVFDDDVIDDGWYSDDEYAEDADDAEAEEEDNGDKQVNKKAIAGIAGGAGALVAASVAAIVIANKKKKDDD